MIPGKLLFFSSCMIFALSIINLSLGPIITKRIGSDWDTDNCEKKSDDFLDYYKNHPNMGIQSYNDKKFSISSCKNQKAMFYMEYMSFTCNLCIGFIGILLGLYFLQDNMIPKTEMIGMCCGIIGFILTFVYLVLNGIIYTQYYATNNIYKTDGDGAFAKYTENKGYKCFYFNDIGDQRSIIAKYSDYIKSQYNYNKKLSDSFKNDRIIRSCTGSSSTLQSCANNEYLKITRSYKDESGIQMPCEKLYYLNENSISDQFYLHNISVHFLMALLISLLILLCYCGFIYFSFTLSKDGSYTSIK
jgi:hypothetical protein